MAEPKRFCTVVPRNCGTVDFRARMRYFDVMLRFGGFFGVLILIADVWAIVNISQSRVSTGVRVFWIVLVLVLPLVGFIIWLFAGPRGEAGN